MSDNIWVTSTPVCAFLRFWEGMQMKVFVQPGKRQRPPRLIFDGVIDDGDIVMEDGELRLSITAEDIYTKKATQRYTITLDADDRACLERAAKG
jgi:hypothetical protein